MPQVRLDLRAVDELFGVAPRARKDRKVPQIMSLKPYEFPKDERFQRLAAKLADAVQVAIWRGNKVNTDRDSMDRCPMGCLEEVDSPRPFPSNAARALECNWDEANAFIAAFDNGHSDGTPWAELGLAYRRRFS